MAEFSPVVAVLDAGKTNKKTLVFDQHYRLIDEFTCRLEETTDEDGDPCEDVHALTAWIKDSLNNLLLSRKYRVVALNFTSYGASFVHLDSAGEPCLPLYNYLKPLSAELQQQLFDRYGGPELFSRQTASPILGHLNSGLLLYRLKMQKPHFSGAGYSLHLPQYLSYVITRNPVSDITSIGCHTMLWDFEKDRYHSWVYDEQVDKKLAPIGRSDSVMRVRYRQHDILCGVGLHDSSSALIPYLATFGDPFILISTGTWSISLNPFNHEPLTLEELAQDCLCYLTYQGNPVKASRLFAGHMHEKGVEKLSEFFSKPADYYTTINFNPEYLTTRDTDFASIDLSSVPDYESGYHMLVADIIQKQVASTNLVVNDGVKNIFVDGGFSKNDIYMKLLASAYPQMKVFAASVAQATALGAAMAIHRHWNNTGLPDDVVHLSPVAGVDRHA